jgi:hypothetical protein
VINDAQKQVLADLLDQESISDILQTMVTITQAESRRLGRPVMAGLGNTRPASLQSCYARKRVMTRLMILRKTTAEVTECELSAQLQYSGPAVSQIGQPVQQVLL